MIPSTYQEAKYTNARPSESRLAARDYRQKSAPFHHETSRVGRNAVVNAYLLKMAIHRLLLVHHA
jgi:hypothetical protein